MAEPTEEEMRRLYEGFEPHDLLDAVDLLDEMRNRFQGPGTDDPSELRIDMLKLHGLAMAVVNNGAAPKTQAMFDLANDVQDEIASMREAIGKIEKTLNRLMDLYPESLAD
jgi:Mg2+ and Co2+ transporter CorA